MVGGGGGGGGEGILVQSATLCRARGPPPTLSPSHLGGTPIRRDEHMGATRSRRCWRCRAHNRGGVRRVLGAVRRRPARGVGGEGDDTRIKGGGGRVGTHTHTPALRRKKPTPPKEMKRVSGARQRVGGQAGALRVGATRSSALARAPAGGSTQAHLGEAATDTTTGASRPRPPPRAAATRGGPAQQEGHRKERDGARLEKKGYNVWWGENKRGSAREETSSLNEGMRAGKNVAGRAKSGHISRESAFRRHADVVRGSPSTRAGWAARGVGGGARRPTRTPFAAHAAEGNPPAPAAVTCAAASRR
jgi:hypothetical protein